LQNTHGNGTRHADPMSAHPGSAIFTEAASDEPTLHTGDFLRVIWERLWIVVLVAIVLAGIAVGVSLLQTPTYAASIKIMVGQQVSGDGTYSNLSSDVAGLQQITETMALAVVTRPVAEEVIRRLDLQESPDLILANTTAEQIGATAFVEVTYKDTSPEEAKQVVNTTGEVFSKQVSQVTVGANGITAAVWEPAVVPYNPISPDPLRNGLLALAVGAMLGLGLAFLLEHLDDRWRSPEEVEQISGIPTLGVIPSFEVVQSKRLREEH
jgi:capsular polysaccharide biosynthesis protein